MPGWRKVPQHQSQQCRESQRNHRIRSKGADLALCLEPAEQGQDEKEGRKQARFSQEEPCPEVRKLTDLAKIWIWMCHGSWAESSRTGLATPPAGWSGALSAASKGVCWKKASVALLQAGCRAFLAE